MSNFATDLNVKQVDGTYRFGELEVKAKNVIGLDDLLSNIANVENEDISTRKYKSGQIILWKGKLYRVKIPIAVNDTFEIDTNIELANNVMTPFVGATNDSNGEQGMVPRPLIDDENKALFSDGTWKEIPNPEVIKGSSPDEDGTEGLVPQPLKGDEDKVLQGDGTWGHTLQMDVVIQNNEYGYINSSGIFIPFKSQADIDAAVTAAIKATKVGNATAADVLEGKTFTNSTTAGLTGTMPNRGKVNPAGLDCGTSYTIPAGYHNGQGIVTANSLISQTKIDSGKSPITAGTIVSGYQGWVNGNKITGTFSGQEKTITSSRSAQTVTPDSGKYLSKVTVNKYPDASGTYDCHYSLDENDMGATNNYRYVNPMPAVAYGAANKDRLSVLLGTVTSDRETFDIKAKYPSKYTQFTVKNFYYVVDKLYIESDGRSLINTPPQFGYSGNPYGQAGVDSFFGTITPTLKYTSSTGKLEVSNLKLTVDANTVCYLSDHTTRLQSTSAQFSVKANISIKVYIIPFLY